MRSWVAPAAFALLVASMLGGVANADTGVNIDHVEANEDGSRISVLLGTSPGVAAEPDTVRVTLDGTTALAKAEPVKSGEIERVVVYTC